MKTELDVRVLRLIMRPGLGLPVPISCSSQNGGDPSAEMTSIQFDRLNGPRL